jgi:hypothetical protein
LGEENEISMMRGKEARLGTMREKEARLGTMRGKEARPLKLPKEDRLRTLWKGGRQRNENPVARRVDFGVEEVTFEVDPFEQA